MPLPARGLGKMDVIEAIYHRRAVREYTSEPVDRETLKFLVDAAIQAPSAVNQQPWSFAVVREQDLLDRISRESKRHMLGTLPAVPASDHFASCWASRPDFLDLLSRAGIDRDRAVARKPVGSGGLLAGGGESDAGDPCRGARLLLDRLRPALAQLAGEAQVGFPAAYTPVAPIIVGRPKAGAASCPRKTPENPLDCLDIKMKF